MKIIKNVTTGCDFQSQSTQNAFMAGALPGPQKGACSAPPDPVARLMEGRKATKVAGVNSLTPFVNV